MVWRKTSALWGIGAGLSGALGALFVVWAIKAGGLSVIVMALVFGLAQVFNFLFSWLLFGLKQQPNWKFGASFLGLVAGSAVVQLFRPGATMATIGFEFGWWLLFSLGTAICWGAYGMCARTAVAHTKHDPKNPQEHGSHFQPLFWVSATYGVFGISTLLYIAIDGTPDVFTATGAQLGFLTGVLGLAGAAMVIPANSVKGSPGPGVIMAVVFASAAIVNAFSNAIFFPPREGTLPWFYVAVFVLAVSTCFFTRNNPTVPGKKPAAAPPL